MPKIMENNLPMLSRKTTAVICKNKDDFENYMLKIYGANPKDTISYTHNALYVEIFCITSYGTFYAIFDKRHIKDMFYNAMEVSFLSGEKESFEELKQNVSKLLHR